MDDCVYIYVYMYVASSNTWIFIFFQLNFDSQKMKQRRWQEIWKASLLSIASLVMRNITLQVV